MFGRRQGGQVHADRCPVGGRGTGRGYAGSCQASSACGGGTGGRKRCGLGGEAEAGEQAAGEVGIGDKGHDGAATTAAELGEHRLGDVQHSAAVGRIFLRAAGRDEHVDFCRVAVTARPRDKEPIELR
jgi:hypothetical protein